MKHFFHRTMAAITLLSMIATMIFTVGIPVSAAEGETAIGGGLTDTMTWSYEDGILTVTGSGDMPVCDRYSRPWDSVGAGIKHLVIAEGVTSVGDDAFSSCKNLESVKFPESLVKIGQYAFYGCRSLQSVAIPGGVTVDYAAFYGCSALASVEFAEGPTNIGGQAFNACSSLQSVKLPEGLSSIGGSAFSGCTGIASVTIPDSVKSIGNNAFFGCESLTGVVFRGSAEQWSQVEIEGLFNSELLAALRIAPPIPGDVTEDDILSVEDLTAMLQLLTLSEGALSAETLSAGRMKLFDLNRDGKVTVKDASRLLRMLESA